MPGDDARAPEPVSPVDGDASFPVVGIGCSAGGLTAVRSLLDGLGPEPNVSVVILHHTDPEQSESLGQILGRATDLPVEIVEEGSVPAVDTVMVVPPGNAVQLRDGRFHLETVDRTVHRDVVDRFLGSLADGLGPRAVGVVLSGSLTDGSRGLLDIQRAGGLTLAQDEASASHPSMPRKAIGDGHADVVLPPEEIGERLARLGEQARDAGREAGPQQRADPGTLEEILRVVKDGTGVDFRNYRSTTLARRIDRRRMARDADTFEAYLRVLEEDPREVEILHDESLIHVTAFFRDPGIFEALREAAFDHLAQVAREDPPVRVWVPGCATGEEAYSLAIALDEHLDGEGIAPRIQLFGTDLSENAIETARDGVYPERIEQDLSDERLQRYFVDEDDHYRVREALRNHCIFARQDLIEDAPFSKIDLVSCRNLLIYLDRERQQRVNATLHYALAPDGVLLLGSAESLHGREDLFEPLDAENRIFRKKNVSPSPYVHQYHPSPTSWPGTPGEASGETRPTSSTLDETTDRLLLDRFAPPGVVVDEDLEVLQFRGDVGTFLSPAEGQASLDLTRIAPPELALAVRSLVQACRGNGEPTERRELQVGTDEGPRTVSVEVHPLRDAPGDPPQAYFVAFVDRPDPLDPSPDSATSLGQTAADLLRGLLADEDPSESERVEQLEAELEETRNHLASVVEQYESMNEELRSANEEALSTTEELQSTNEELATAKEEIQASNEELTTLNDELTERNEALHDLNDDLTNLLRSVDLPILMLDAEMRIRRSTPAARDLFNLREGDEGRRLTDLRHPFGDEDVQAIAREVLDSLQMVSREVETRDGDRYELRVRPYRTRDDETTGTVMVLWGPQAAVEV